MSFFIMFPTQICTKTPTKWLPAGALCGDKNHPAEIRQLPLAHLSSTNGDLALLGGEKKNQQPPFHFGDHQLS